MNVAVEKRQLTFHLGVGTNNMEDGPTVQCLSQSRTRDMRAKTHPNSSYNCLTKNIMRTHEAAITEGATINKGLTVCQSVPGPPQSFKGVKMWFQFQQRGERTT